MTPEEKMKRWVDTWKSAGPELDRIKQEELRAMDEKTSARVFDSLNSYSPSEYWESPEYSNGLGLVQQQFFFSKARLNASRH